MPRKHFVTFDRDRTVRVCRAAEQAWLKGTYGFDAFAAPETMVLPPRDDAHYGSREHALTQFFAAWMQRSGKTALQLMRDTERIARESPAIIDPLAEEPDNFVAELTRSIPFANTNPERIDWWRQSLALLRDEFDGDPRNLFVHLTIGDKPEEVWQARDALIKRLCRFMGVQHKIAQLMIIWFQDIDWPGHATHWQRIRRIPAIPADIWILRLMGQTECVALAQGGNSHRDRISLPVATYIARLCLEEGLNHGAVAQGLWHAGARVDKYRPKRDLVAQARYCLTHCPLHDDCVAVVRANPQQTNRGTVGWETPTARAHSLFQQSDFPGGIAVVKSKKGDETAGVPDTVPDELVQLQLFVHEP